MIDYKKVNSFIGKPWVYIENDCWAVVKQASKAIFGVEILEIVDIPDCPNDICTQLAIADQIKKSRWVRRDSPVGGEVVVMYSATGQPVHVGLYVENGNILHCFGGENVKNGKARYDHISVIKLLYPRLEFYLYV